MSEHSAILAQLLEQATYYAGQEATPEDRLYADLDISGGDMVEFVIEVERRYGADLSAFWPRDRRKAAQDPTIQTLADEVARQRA